MTRLTSLSMSSNLMVAPSTVKSIFLFVIFNLIVHFELLHVILNIISYS
jgi:hypothetical protein